MIRSTWDYIADPDAFLTVLAEIERAGTPLFNPLDLVRWNIRKTYCAIWLSAEFQSCRRSGVNGSSRRGAGAN